MWNHEHCLEEIDFVSQSNWMTFLYQEELYLLFAVFVAQCWRQNEQNNLHIKSNQLAHNW